MHVVLAVSPGCLFVPDKMAPNQLAFRAFPFSCSTDTVILSIPLLHAIFDLLIYILFQGAGLRLRLRLGAACKTFPGAF